MHTHQILPGCSLLGRTWPRRRPSGGFQPHAGTHTHMHTRHWRPVRLLHEQIRTRTRALHLHGRRTYASLLCSRPSHHMPTCSPLDGRVALRRAAARRRRRAALAAARGSTAAAAAAAAAEVLGSTPTMAAAADKEPVRVERETPIPPTPLPVSDAVPVADARPAESSERGGARCTLAACRRRRLVALARRCRGG